MITSSLCYKARPCVGKEEKGGKDEELWKPWFSFDICKDRRIGVIPGKCGLQIHQSSRVSDDYTGNFFPLISNQVSYL